MRRLVLYIIASIAATSAAQTVAPAPTQFQQPVYAESPAQFSALMNATESTVLLEVGDLLSLRVAGADAFTERTRIAPGGTVDVPLAGPIIVAGLTVEQAQQAIATSLRTQNLVLAPAVTLDVLEQPGRVIILSGQVKSSGVYPVNGRRTLEEVLSQAGGITDSASNVITLVRPTLPAPVTIVLGPDPANQPAGQLPLFAGDTIRVSRIGQAYIVGAVKNQGAIPLKNFSPTTVAEAVAMSGGMGFEASANSAKIVRTQGTQRTMIDVAVGRILRGKSPDIALQNDDILYIPTNQAKAAVKGGGANLIVGIASAYIYTSQR